MTRVIKLRLKLSDFIDTDLESMIMERIKAIENDLNIKIILYFWLGDEDVNLKEFYERWKDNLSIKTIIKNNSSLKANEFIYFDIAPHDIDYNSNVRFQAKYKFIEEETQRISTSLGFVQEKNIQLTLSSVMGAGHKYEPIFVFRKGD